MNQPIYPHIKLTRERFPRLLATRKIDDDAEYFGAFLNRTSVRILIDFLNRTFNLRTCEIGVDGSFEVPCTMHYAKRCVAPCVESLCDEKSYSETVELVRLFLRNDRKEFRSELLRRIERASEELDFERAALERDVLQAAENFWSKNRWQVWLDDTIDTYRFVEEDGSRYLFLITQRRGKMLGNLVFDLDVENEDTLADVISQLYIYHAPREIRVPHDFRGRREFSKQLTEKFGRKIPIVVASSLPTLTTGRALERTRIHLSLANMTRPQTPGQIGNALKRIFKLNALPKRIAAFDVSHISGTRLVAAMSIWENGRFDSNAYRYWNSDRTSELETIGAFIASTVQGVRSPTVREGADGIASALPYGRASDTAIDLVLIDGGKNHLKAAIDALKNIEREFQMIAAVKPRGRHGDISHFLTEVGEKIDFDDSSQALRILKILRDEAHDLSNAVHGEGRDMSHFYELAGVLPSLNEKERQKLLAEFGSIRKILELSETDLLKILEAHRVNNALADLKNHKAGNSVPVSPLIVPIRFTDENGNADDLRPIKTKI